MSERSNNKLAEVAINSIADKFKETLDIVANSLLSAEIEQLVDLAIDSGDLDLGKFLLNLAEERKFDVHWAAANGHLELLELFLAKKREMEGSQITKKSASPSQLKEQAQMYISEPQKYNLEILKAKLKNSVYLMKQNLKKTIPLHVASDPQVAKILIHSGNDVNASDKHGRTPLHKAAMAKKPELAQLLIGAGANMMALDENKCSPFHLALETGDYEVARVFFRSISPDDRPKIASDARSSVSAFEGGNMEMINKLIKWGACEKLPELYSGLLLFSASTAVAAQFLVDRGADVNKPNSERITPLYTACLKGRIGVVKVLLKAGADPNSKNSTFIPLNAAVRHPQVVSLLLEQGADPNGEVCSQIASNGQLAQEPTEFAPLIPYGGEFLDSSDDFDFILDGNTRPLHIAAGCGFLDTMQILLTAGAFVNIPDEDGNTPLDFCEPKYRNFLLAWGAKTGDQVKLEARMNKSSVLDERSNSIDRTQNIKRGQSNESVGSKSRQIESCGSEDRIRKGREAEAFRVSR